MLFQCFAAASAAANLITFASMAKREELNLKLFNVSSIRESFRHEVLRLVGCFFPLMVDPKVVLSISRPLSTTF